MSSFLPSPAALKATLRIVFLGAAALTVGSSASAQEIPFDPADGEHIEIVLMTVAPGDLIWEHYGHNELVVFDRRTGALSYSWGVFDLEREGFSRDFFFGEWKYRLAVFPFERQAKFYQSFGRALWLQRLELTAAQRAELAAFLEWNARPENCWYLYDYYKDNCSTRIRDAIDRSLGGVLRAKWGQEPGTRASGEGPTSFRYHTLRLSGRLTPSALIAYLGTMLVFGPSIEEPSMVWDEMFVPLELRDAVRETMVENEAGAMVSLVTREETIPPGAKPSDPRSAPQWTLLFFGAACFAGALFLLLARAARRSTAVRWLFGGLATGGAFFIGFCGVFILLVWAITEHQAARPNFNAFHFTPVSLLLAAFLPWAVAGHAGALRWAKRMAALALGLSLLGLVLKLVPALDQVNGPLLALVLPAHGALWLSLRRWPVKGGDGPAEVESPPTVA